MRNISSLCGCMALPGWKDGYREDYGSVVRGGRNPARRILLFSRRWDRSSTSFPCAHSRLSNGCSYTQRCKGGDLRCCQPRPTYLSSTPGRPAEETRLEAFELHAASLPMSSFSMGSTRLSRPMINNYSSTSYRRRYTPSIQHSVSSFAAVRSQPLSPHSTTLTLH